MTHFPYLEKQYIDNVLKPYSAKQEKSWKHHLNSQILQMYVEIKRQQKQKLAEILPYYHIFPRNHHEYNFYTSNYDLDRLQRIKNAKKYNLQNKKSNYIKNSKIEQNTNLNSSKSQSQINFRTHKKYENNRQQLNTLSILKVKENKSTKSLTQTNFSPSKFSKDNQQRNRPRQTYHNSDLQISLQNYNRQKNPKNSKEKGKIDLSQFKQKKLQRNFNNIKSTLTLTKQRRNEIFNQYYNEQRSRIKENKKSSYSELHEKVGFKDKDNREQFSLHPKLTSQDSKIMKSKKIVGNQQFQFNKIDKKEICLTDKNINKFQQISENKQRNKQEFQTSKKMREYKLQNQDYQKSTASQKLPFNLKVNSPKFNRQNNQFKDKYQSRQHQINHQSNYNLITRQNNTKNFQQKTIEETRRDNMEQKLAQYYGEQFEKVRQQRDYLRKHFILHLQKKHTAELPYKELIQIKTDYSTNKLTIQKQSISVQKSKKHKDIITINMKN